MPKLTFSGHESFTCRQFWLKKGYDFLSEGRDFADPDAVVYLGVGKNMVTSIHYWLKSFDLIGDNGHPGQIAQFLLADGGVDPYLEQPGTLWLLHYLLVTRGRASLYNIAFNDFRREHPIFTKAQLANYIVRLCTELDLPVSPASIQRDVEVLVRSYARPQRRSASPEDDYTTLLIDLDLLDTIEMAKADGGVRYAIERRTRSELPMHVVLYAILDHFQGRSISFRDLANDRNGPGTVFALNDDGLLNQINAITSYYPDIIFTDDAGIRELQFRLRPDASKVLNDYYRS